MKKMGKPKKAHLIHHLKVRTSLVLVLVFFLLMLVAGAGLGLWALYTNNQSLKQIAQNQAIDSTLSQSIDQYKNVQAMLGRALSGYIVNYTKAAPAADSGADAASSGQAGATSAAAGASDAKLGQEAQSYVKNAQQAVETSEAMFGTYKRLVEGRTDTVYKDLNDAYDALMSQGVKPMLAAISKGDMAGYHDVLSTTMAINEDMFYQALGAVHAHQKQLISVAENAEQVRYQRIEMLVSGAVVLCIFIALLVHVLLGRVVLRPLHTAKEHFERIAAGDLTARIDVWSRNEIGVLFEALRHMQESLTKTVSAVRRGVDEIALGSREIYDGNTDLSSRTEQQAASLQQTAASMEELASTVKQNTDNAQQADRLAKKSSDVAKRGGAAVGEVVGSMDAISASANKISEIVAVIDGIAFQTNILALNAAVEAARAGEQGKGFAVVAGEVRSLAQRSAQAAKEVKTLIEESQTRVQTGSTQVREAGDIIAQVVESVAGVTTIMDEIASASREQSDGIGQINQAVSQMDEVVQQNAALVEQAAAASGSLQDQAAHLREAVKVFKLKDNTIVDIRDEPRAMQSRREPQQLESARVAQTAAQGAPRTLSAPVSPTPKAAAGRLAGRQGTSSAPGNVSSATKKPDIRRTPERKRAAPATTADDDDWTEF